jgi:hypothetical protein
MSQAYKVAQAFQATVSKEDKTPKVVEFDGHTFNAWKVKLDGESGKGWINVNKKPGNEIAPGDELYGDIVQIDGKFGTFYNFKSASRPLGDAPTSQPAASAPAEDFTQGVVSELTQDKLDYIIGLAEAIAEAVGANEAKPSTTAPDLDDLDI